ncbi:MAG: hypothetical protein WA966_04650 [Ornithinimicrobium sp.]
MRPLRCHRTSRGSAPARVSAAITVALLVCGCGSNDNIRAEELSPDAVADMVDSHAEIQGQAQELMDQIRGTGTERAAAQFLVDAALNLPTARCMTEKGFQWDPPELRARPAVIIEPFGGSVWLREPMRRISSEQLQVTAASARAEEGAGFTSTPASERALTECLNDTATQAPSDDVLDAEYGYDPDAAELDSEFTELIARVDGSLAAPGEYESCMNALGTPQASEQRGYAAVRAYLEGDEAPDLSQVPRVDSEVPPSPAWVEFQREEHRVLLDDAACRAGQYDEAMTEMAGELERFARSNAAQLQARDSYWQGLQDRARGYGFDEDEPTSPVR